MILIPDNETLRSFIPNVMAPAVGSTPLFDKVSPSLRSAERWFIQTFINERMLEKIVADSQHEEDPFYFLPRRIVVLKAWLTAVPSIDVVVGPTGVGVTETNTLKPASKAKMENLMSAIREDLDFNIESLLKVLPSLPGWLESNEADFFRKTLFPDFALVDALEIRKNRWDNWLSLSRRASVIEARLENEWISVPVMARLRSAALEGSSTGIFRSVLDLAREIVIEEIRTGCPQKGLCLDLVNMIRKNKTEFPEWESSDTAGRFKNHSFVNQKSNSGYWL